MEKEEILEKAKKKHPVGEMEMSKVNKSSWIALAATAICAIVLMIIEGARGHFSSLYVVAFICYLWASIFYFCQYFVAKRPRPVLIGAILYTVAAIIMIVLYILNFIGVM